MYRIIFALFLLFPAPLFAKESDFVCAEGKRLKSADAKRYLQAAQEAYAEVSSLKAGFLQESYLSSLETSEASSGTLYFQKPGRMRWEYIEPEKQTFLILDQTLWFYQAVDKQVVVDNFSDFLVSELPVAFILGIGDLGKSFDIENGCRDSATKSIILNLKPKSKGEERDERLNRFSLVVDDARFIPLRARITDVASNVNSFYLEKIEVNSEIPKEIFLPEFPEGVDFDDRRHR